jgi:hypothetical protein
MLNSTTSTRLEKQSISIILHMLLLMVKGYPSVEDIVTTTTTAKGSKILGGKDCMGHIITKKNSKPRPSKLHEHPASKPQKLMEQSVPNDSNKKIL